MNLNQITLPARDMPASVTFYRKMGFVQIVDAPHYARFRALEGDATFSLHQTEIAGLPGQAVVYFECTNLDAQVQRLQALGFSFRQLPRDEAWRWREARLVDPSGNELCLYYAGANRLDPPWRLRSVQELPVCVASAPVAESLPFQTEPVLLTTRLRIRRLLERDLPAMMEIHGRPQVNRYIPFRPWRGLDDARLWFAKVRQRHSTGSGLHLAVTLPTHSERLIATTQLFGFDQENGTAELGYAANLYFRRQGYVREAVRATIDYAFTELGLRKLEATVDTRNPASTRLLLALGFVHEGCRREQEFCKGELVSLNVYGLLRSEWSECDS